MVSPGCGRAHILPYFSSFCISYPERTPQKTKIKWVWVVVCLPLKSPQVALQRRVGDRPGQTRDLRNNWRQWSCLRQTWNSEIKVSWRLNALHSGCGQGYCMINFTAAKRRGLHGSHHKKQTITLTGDWGIADAMVLRAVPQVHVSHHHAACTEHMFNKNKLKKKSKGSDLNSPIARTLLRDNPEHFNMEQVLF